MQKELLLEGLNCKSCLSKIAKDIKKIDPDIKVDYDAKTITLSFDKNKDYYKIINNINNILNQHHHQIKIQEKEISASHRESYMIAHLTCANCAKKMETKIKNISGVKSATLDFATSKLNIEVYKKSQLKNVLQEVNAAIKEVEKDVEIVNFKDNKKEEVHEERHQEDHMVRNTLISVILSLIPLLVAIIGQIEGLIGLILYIVSYVIIGRKVIFSAIKNILHGEIFDENFLMMIATIGAFVIGEYHEAIAVMIFYEIGEMFQDLAVDKSRKSISKLMDIRPDSANLKVGSELKKVKPETVSVGSLIVVKPGEKVPLDGVVVEGASYVDTSSITGESLPKHIAPNDQVLSGYINKDQMLVIKTTKAYGESTVAKILDMVENASVKKAKTEKFITRFARFYTPIVVIVAFLLAVIPTLVFKQDFNVWLYRALSFLVVSCPCALVISIPLGFFGGIGLSSRLGILVKGGDFLEALNDVETVVFDKTGTLTKGNFVVKKLNALNISEEKLLDLAATAEGYSIHPLALAIKKAYGKDIDLTRITKYQEYAGLGVSAIIDGNNVLAGNKNLLEKFNIAYQDEILTGTVIYLAINNEYVGNIVIVDEVKDEAKNAIEALKTVGVTKTIMLTGDKESVANNVAFELGIDQVFAELLPNDKVKVFEEKIVSSNPNKKIAFVGDGINDAPVLATSDIGISMGALGSDAAIEASDIVIMNDNLMNLAKAKKVAKKTKTVVWQNIIFALAVKTFILVLIAFGIGTMWSAVFADVGVSLIAILNAIRILKAKIS